MKLVAKIVFQDGTFGYLKIKYCKAFSKEIMLVGSPSEATGVGSRIDAERLVEEYRKDIKWPFEAQYILVHDNGEEEVLTQDDSTPSVETKFEGEELSAQEKPSFPDPIDSIMVMYRNRINDVEEALKILGLKIKENKLAEIPTAYATAVMSFAAVSDYADFFDSIVKNLQISVKK